MDRRTLAPIVAFVALMAALAAPVATAAPAEAQEPPVTLKVGDPAPPLQVGKWLKGGPINQLEKGKVYVIECWATWCGPCVAAMPHVTQLQAKYRDKNVTVIGVNVWERDLAAPEPFVKKMGDKMGNAVVMDDTTGVAPGEPGKMAKTWLMAAGQNGIPCSFLVDRQGKIAWIGHPMQMNRPLGALAENRFDPAEEAKFQAKRDGLFEQYSTAMRAKDDAKALGVLDELATLDPDMAPQFRTAKLGLLVRKGDYDAANALAKSLTDDKGGVDRSMHATIASTLLSAPDPTKVDTALALKLANSAYENNGKEGWQYEMLLARAYAVNKQYDKAVEVQTKALQTAPEQVKEREEKTLAEYKEKAAAGAKK
jgi:thiol-disulfide isomerase/thioredoxin